MLVVVVVSCIFSSLSDTPHLQIANWSWHTRSCGGPLMHKHSHWVGSTESTQTYSIYLWDAPEEEETLLKAQLTFVGDVAKIRFLWMSRQCHRWMAHCDGDENDAAGGQHLRPQTRWNCAHCCVLARRWHAGIVCACNDREGGTCVLLVNLKLYGTGCCVCINYDKWLI